MPYLSTNDRELLISRYCGDCLDALFKDDDEPEENIDCYDYLQQ